MTKSEMIREFMTNKISYIASTPNSNAILANLRRGNGKKPGDDFSLLSLIMQGMPSNFYSKNGEPTREEWSCYIALVCFALHQRGHDIKKECMHAFSKDNQNLSIGYAASKLVKNKDDFNEVEKYLRKIRAIINASNMEGKFLYLTNLIKFLNHDSITLDYALLASDIYKLTFPDSTHKITLKWTQDYLNN